MERCGGCGKAIGLNEASYYRKGPNDDMGTAYHAGCGDPLGLKAKDARIAELEAEIKRLQAEVRRQNKMLDDAGYF